MKPAAFETASLEALARPARARVIAAELLDEFLVAMDDAIAALDPGFAVESPSGVCSSAQKLKSLILVRMASSSIFEAQASLPKLPLVSSG